MAVEKALERTARLLGEAAVERLAQSHVAVFGLGGVGGHAAEALVRSGVGTITVVDHDTISESNLNRQLLATCDTLGMRKIDAFAARARSLSPRIRLHTYSLFYLPEQAEVPDFAPFDYVIDAIDTVAGKVQIARSAAAAGVPLLACMGTGNKLDPMGFRVAPLSKTCGCPLAKSVRNAMKRGGIAAESVKTVFSAEPPIEPTPTEEEAAAGKHHIPASVAFVPAAAGLLLAAEAIRDLIGTGTPLVPRICIKKEFE